MTHVEEIILIHHDPKKNDKELDDIQGNIDKFRIDEEKNGVNYPPCTFGKPEKEYHI